MRQPVAVLIAVLPLAAGSVSSAKGPSLTGLFPAGGARGQAVIVAASGTFDHWPVQGWSDRSGLAIEAGAEKGKLQFRIAEDAEPGIRWIRLYDEEGATALRPFIVGTLPEIVEVEPNNDAKHFQAVAMPSATINGRLGNAGDVDGFSVSLRKGQTLSADLEANRRLGSPMDAVLQVVSGSGFVLAQNDDTVGRDPRIVFEAPADGQYVVRVFGFPETPGSSIAFAGGDSFIYRLTLTTAGFLDHAFPMAVSRDNPSKVGAVGVNIPEGARDLVVPDDDAREVRCVSHPLLAGTSEVVAVPGLAGVEDETGDPALPQEIPDLSTVNGQIHEPGDRDNYRLSLMAGEKRLIQVRSRTMGMRLDPVLRVTDAAGKVIAEADDVGEGRDPELTFAAPADGEYRLNVRDLNDRGGPRFSYMLRVLATEPNFSLSLATDRFVATSGAETSVAVTIDRQFGFSDDIEFVAEDLPDGVTSKPAVSKPGDASSKTVTVTLSAAVGARSGQFRLVGRAAGGQVQRAAVAAIEGFSVKTDLPWLTTHSANEPAKP